MTTPAHIPSAAAPAPTELVDAIIVGGGAAGLSAALMLGRSRRSVIVVDGGQPRNAPADGVHGFLSRDGIPPRELVRLGRAEVAAYGVLVIDAQVGTAVRDDEGFVLTTTDGASLRGRRLLIATGTADELPDIPGLRERYGRDALHCPYCHGWEVQDRVIGILGTDAQAAAHQAQLFRQLSERVIVLRNTAEAFDGEHRAAFDARGIEVVDGLVERLEVEDDRLVGVRLADGRTVRVDALAVAPVARVHAAAFAELGVQTQPHPAGAHYGDAIGVDAMGATSVPGVWAAGDVTSLRPQVVQAAAAGAMAGAAMNADLVQDDVRRALAER
ncbi:NAD(P)/FAD-dependent oxidoreductase [Plantibacter sp. ME-Dv--P-095]|uniref:NAD(P)/FAD-dependent oxidoreductase n=1 Tax=Plantibacter sp. ME-Dv--P-095 TaxID=3040299 RepID=UPI00254BAF15|nr:NAD(P)/FAD-dependent oxidoreductase [Plantibacter sp. ME-Dv--P-095]